MSLIGKLVEKEAMGKKTLGRVIIVGSGAVGCYYGARLVEAGEDVTFLMRSDIPVSPLAA